MSPKVLTRCDVCKNWHAIYIVDDPVLGKIKICHQCWMSRYTPSENLVKDDKKSPPAGSELPKSKHSPHRK